MSILINLLPDLRQAKQRERRRRQMVAGISIVVWIVCGGVVALMGAYELGQKAVIAGHTKAITDKKQQLQDVPDLLDALTAQQHSAALADLYAQRVYMTKFLGAYTEANPGNVTLNSMTIDSQNAMIVSGTASSYAVLAKLARALEAANVKVGTDASANNEPYFTGVTITSASNTTGKGITFTLNATVGTEAVHGK